MNDKINQNPDSSLLKSSWSESLKQRAEVQQNLKKQLQALKSLQEQVKQSSNVEKTNRNITHQLLSLEDRIQQLDQLKQEAFDIQAEKIQQELDVLKASLKALAGLKKQIRASFPDLYTKIQNQLPGHNTKANRGRASAVGNLASFVQGNGFMKWLLTRAWLYKI